MIHIVKEREKSDMSKCDKCLTDKSECVNCCDNPVYANVPKESRYKDYIPACPKGYPDCKHDPAYIKQHFPEWYTELFGKLPIEDAIKYGCDTTGNFNCYKTLKP